jgi:hypothetical protein
MSVAPEDRSQRLRDASEFRESLRERLDRYLDLPLALASILLVLIALIELGGKVEEPWRGRLAVLGWLLGALLATCIYLVLVLREMVLAELVEERWTEQEASTATTRAGLLAEARPFSSLTYS